MAWRFLIIRRSAMASQTTRVPATTSTCCGRQGRNHGCLYIHVPSQESTIPIVSLLPFMPRNMVSSTLLDGDCLVLSRLPRPNNGYYGTQTKPSYVPGVPRTSTCRVFLSPRTTSKPWNLTSKMATPSGRIARSLSLHRSMTTTLS